MKIYIQNHSSNAGKWIYNGYSHAWIYKEFSVQFIDSLSEVNDDGEYHLMITDGFVNQKDFSVIEKSKKTILYASPNFFPEPWGSHPNWRCPLSKDSISKLNNLENVIKWNFSDINSEFFSLWENVYSFPLAFDNINYDSLIQNEYEYDICYVGGIADNGFNEKIKIIESVFKSFAKSGLKCAFAINYNLTHEQENHILNNSKICLNIHDQYQRKLSLDTNERTFKGLGSTGFIVSDKINQLERLFPNVFTSNEADQLVDFCLQFVKKTNEEINFIKRNNQKFIEKNHTYINRVEKFLSL
jgi:hypothetical protein